MSEAMDLDALLVDLREALARVHARLGNGPLRLGPVELVLRGQVSAGPEGFTFVPGGTNEVSAFFLKEEPKGVPPVTPMLLGLTRAAATRRARSSGAALEVTEVPCLSPEQAGRVCWQRPAPGEPLVDGRIAVGLNSTRG
ncbi:hypothetical protein [Myxococcus sp. RHSTA-1-4]|uniref:hypothetical protein n=1 Tax=Myxococcus sp. RHSTA-1-4 TaxID=2874601 RepID=UPI001CBFDF69|nr:hypothetical protein [Myxococcus sp. RHSTA-1-4]MBZ4421733.1 hypothetical protein [Myxococcus sp. RHSTA-1-4]